MIEREYGTFSYYLEEYLQNREAMTKVGEGHNRDWFQACAEQAADRMDELVKEGDG